MHKAMKHRFRGVVFALWHAAERALHWVSGRNRSSYAPSILCQDGRSAIASALERCLQSDDRLKQQATAMVLELDDYASIEAVLTRDEQDLLWQAITDRMSRLLRYGDTLARLEGPRIGFSLTPNRRLDLESAIQFATRLQHVLADPISLPNRLTAVSASVGFALAGRLEKACGANLLRAAGLAQIEASRAGPRAIRSYSAAMEQRVRSRSGLLDQINIAFEEGHFIALFQPQVHLESGQITGFEALARWHHPGRGLIPPAEFLPVIEHSGQIGRLGQTMLTQSLSALADWDAQGLNVPQVSINLSNVELRNPGLVDFVRFELDRHNLSAKRLVVEVLETVVSYSGDDLILENLGKLADMGCGVDLDDFGTGHTSITSIRKFAVNRIKIDRTFITKIDKDEEQQSMVAAILTMADRLGLATLAEGVETTEEREMLRVMGCEIMQGFELARPMNRKEVSLWVAAQEAIYQAPAHLRRVR